MLPQKRTEARYQLLDAQVPLDHAFLPRGAIDIELSLQFRVPGPYRVELLGLELLHLCLPLLDRSQHRPPPDPRRNCFTKNGFPRRLLLIWQKKLCNMLKQSERGQ
jgi:hypothetical protein